jgi:poly-gamma-glutamate capsule biosynthesis protein CapA/YwtB (metallophosphatase superfamily)
LITLASFSYLLFWLLGKQDDNTAGNAAPATRSLEVSKSGTVAKDAQTGITGNAINGNADKQAGGTGTGSAIGAGTGVGAGTGTGTSTSGGNGALAGSSTGNGVAGNGQGLGSAAAPNGSAISNNGTSVKLTFVGDVMFAGNVEELLKKNGWDYPYRFMKEYLDKADITIANLETPISTRGTAQTKEYVYRSSVAALPSFKNAGFDLVNTANNHIMDYGVEALRDTMDALDQADIKRVGIGNTAEEAYKPVIMERNGIKVAFLGFSRNVPDTGWFVGKQKPGVAETYTTKLPLEAISKARKEADIVVVIAHWGVERKDVPVKEQTDLAHKYIDEGADLVIASHPHVLQGFEQYKDKWIAYSLGNFIFTTNAEPTTWETMVLDAVCTKDRKCSLQMLPVLTKGAQPVRMTEADGTKLMDRMTRISFNARVDKDGRILTAPAKKPVSEVPEAKAPAAKPVEKKNGDGASSGASTQPVKPAPATNTDKPSSTQQPKPSTQQLPKSSTQQEQKR